MATCKNKVTVELQQQGSMVSFNDEGPSQHQSQTSNHLIHDATAEPSRTWRGGRVFRGGIGRGSRGRGAVGVDRSVGACSGGRVRGAGRGEGGVITKSGRGEGGVTTRSGRGGASTGGRRSAAGAVGRGIGGRGRGGGRVLFGAGLFVTGGGTSFFNVAKAPQHYKVCMGFEGINVLVK